jgi:hypothetical protein
MNKMTRAQLLEELAEERGKYEHHEAVNESFAFWHEVGVTGLGTLGTVCLGIAELVDDGHSLYLRVGAMFTTATIAVFGACNQFFAFKPAAKEYGTAVGRLNALERELNRTGENDAERLIQLSTDIDDIVSSSRRKPISRIVWGGRAQIGIPITVAMVIFLLVGAELLVGRFGRAAPHDAGHPDGARAGASGAPADESPTVSSARRSQ